MEHRVNTHAKRRRRPPGVTSPLHPTNESVVTAMLNLHLAVRRPEAGEYRPYGDFQQSASRLYPHQLLMQVVSNSQRAIESGKAIGRKDGRECFPLVFPFLNNLGVNIGIDPRTLRMNDEQKNKVMFDLARKKIYDNIMIVGTNAITGTLDPSQTSDRTETTLLYAGNMTVLNNGEYRFAHGDPVSARLPTYEEVKKHQSVGNRTDPEGVTVHRPILVPQDEMINDYVQLVFTEFKYGNVGTGSISDYAVRASELCKILNTAVNPNDVANVLATVNDGSNRDNKEAVYTALFGCPLHHMRVIKNWYVGRAVNVRDPGSDFNIFRALQA